MAQLVQGLRCEKPRPSTCQVKASVQPSPWQAAGPHNSYLSRLNALYSGISDQKAQPCTLVYETLPPEPHPLCPRRPCEPHLRQGSSGQALQTEEGQGHGGFLQTSKGRTDPETKVRPGIWEHGAVRRRMGLWGSGLEGRTEVDIGISACRGFGIVAWWW